MKNRKKGRRIYTYRARNRRVFSRNHPMRSALGTTVLLVLLAVCGVVGYNVIGPIVTRVNQEAEHPTTTPDPYYTADNSESGDPEAPQTTEKPAVTTRRITTAAAETTTVTTTTEPLPTRFPEDAEVMYLLPEEALKDFQTLDRYAEDAAGQGYNEILLTLKCKGGMLQYASGNDRAKTSGASNGNMLTLREITNLASRYHLDCAALFSTLEDHVYPNVYMDGSFTFKDGSTRWLDNKPEQGGKPWLNPFDGASGTYLAALASEIELGGFKHILCTDTVFPHFFRSDAELLGNRIQDDKQRKDALVSVLNTITEAAPTAGSYISLAELVLGHEEAFDAEQLNMKQVFVRIDPLDLPQEFTLGGQRFDPAPLAPDDRLLLLASAAQQAIGNRKLIPVVPVGGKSESEVTHMIEMLYDAGYQTICAEPASEQNGEDSVTDESSAE